MRIGLGKDGYEMEASLPSWRKEIISISMKGKKERDG
jgi:hypothetical protein